MNLYYEIDENNAVRVWDIDNPLPDNAPFILQPWWPNQTSWTRDEAEGWAITLIDSLTNPDAEFQPGNSSEQPKIPIVRP